MPERWANVPNRVGSTNMTMLGSPVHTFPRPIEPLEPPRPMPEVDLKQAAEAQRLLAETVEGITKIGAPRRASRNASAKTLPDRMRLGVLRDRSHRVVIPILVNFEEEDGQALARAHAFDEYGFGATRQEALGDLQLALVELYDSLADEQDNLGPEMRDIWRHLQHSIVLREY